MERIARFYIFVAFLIVMVVSTPCALLYSIGLFIHSKYWPAFGVLAIPFLTYLLTLSRLSDVCLFPENYSKVRDLLRDTFLRKIGNVLSLGLYNSVILCFLKEPWGNWLFIFWSFSTFPLINWWHTREFLTRSDVKKKITTDISIRKLFICGELIPFVFDAINGK